MEQLIALDMLDEDDYGGSSRDPMTIQDLQVGRKTPALYSFNYDTRDYEPWTASAPPVPFIDPQDEDLPAFTDVSIGVPKSVASQDGSTPSSLTCIVIAAETVQ
jgi:hypothetical protein